MEKKQDRSALGQESAQSAGPKKRVFLADDHRLVREGLAALLDRTGQFEVVGQCGNGLDVVDQAAKLGPDVVVLDVELPGLNGIDVCHGLKRKLPDTVVLVLSMHDDESFVIRALQNGARGYLLKDSAGSDLAEAIRTVMAGQMFIGSGIDKNVLSRLHRPHVEPYDTLTSRERQVLQLIAEGKTNRKIGEALGLAVKTVDTHRMRLMRKLEIHDQTTLVKFFLKRNGVWHLGSGDASPDSRKQL
ncbi:MAG: response regulator transcription factor [Planctomycetota bacterium]|nr:response regulator transcription factor [Planctomycetota bacterium]